LRYPAEVKQFPHSIDVTMLRLEVVDTCREKVSTPIVTLAT
jgi:hypothetical protein